MYVCTMCFVVWLFMWSEGLIVSRVFKKKLSHDNFTTIIVGFMQQGFRAWIIEPI